MLSLHRQDPTNETVCPRTLQLPNVLVSTLEVRGARASSVIVQRISREAAEAFMEWQHGITAVAASPGYQATEIYPPAEPRQQEWVVILHFDNATTLQHWLDSAERAAWIANCPFGSDDYRLKMLPTGFGSWFAGIRRRRQTAAALEDGPHGAVRPLSDGHVAHHVPGAAHAAFRHRGRHFNRQRGQRVLPGMARHARNQPAARPLAVQMGAMDELSILSA